MGVSNKEAAAIVIREAKRYDVSFFLCEILTNKSKVIQC